MVTDSAANIISRHDYLPFGEEIPANIAGRRSEWGPFGDKVNQKFTGQERDDETGFDFFQARYFYGAQGRFNGPDPNQGSMDVTNPQTFNRYAYVLNDPLVNTDPTGADVCADGSYADACVTASPDPVPTDPCWYCGYSGGGSRRPQQTQPPSVIQEVQQLGQQAFDWLSQPRNPNCLGASTAAGASAGAAVGMLGVVGGPALGVTEPTSVAIGGGIGWLGGMISCMSSSTGSGGGSGGSTGGTQVISKTLWRDGKGGRIDVENPNPGQRAGQIHYQDQTGKYLYDPQTGRFDGAPNRVNELLSDPTVQAAIQKGLRYLGQ